MYVRPRLSRNRTEDRELLSKEQYAEVDIYKHTLAVGKAYESDLEKTARMIDAVSQNNCVSDEDKKRIIDQLMQLQKKLQEEYSDQVGTELADIEYSMTERIDEVEAAAKLREVDVFRAESEIWLTDAVDKEKLVTEYKEVLRKYEELLGEAKAELQMLMKEADEQKQRIGEYRTKR